jgi:hypothetical protein
VVKAAECCIDLLRKLKDYKVKIPRGRVNSIKPNDVNQYDEKELRIHLGIGAGKIYDVHVGGEPGRWEHFVVGDAMEQLALVLDMAKPGQVAISRTAYDAFKTCVIINRVSLESFDDNKYYILNALDKTAINLILPESESESDDFMALWDIQVNNVPAAAAIEFYRQYINQSALFKLESDIQSASPFQLNQGVGHLMNLNELRQVTTLFIKIGDLSFAYVDRTEEMIRQQILLVDGNHLLSASLVAEIEEVTAKMEEFKENAAELAKLQESLSNLQARHKEVLETLSEQEKHLVDLRMNLEKEQDEALNRCQTAMTEVQVGLKKFEGILRQFHVDDKGAVILAFFGLPPLAHKNDALLGLQAGICIRDGFRKYFKYFSIGISTGVISIGGVGNSLRTEYALVCVYLISKCDSTNTVSLFNLDDRWVILLIWQLD